MSKGPSGVSMHRGTRGDEECLLNGLRATWFVDDDDFHLDGFLTEMILQRARVQTTVSALHLGHD